jgi:hypothetical protein
MAWGDAGLAILARKTDVGRVLKFPGAQPLGFYGVVGFATTGLYALGFDTRCFSLADCKAAARSATSREELLAELERRARH